MSTQIVNWHAAVFEVMLAKGARPAGWRERLAEIRAEASAYVKSRGADGSLACPFDDRVEIQRIIGRIDQLTGEK
jgi:hypothetical protein